VSDELSYEAKLLKLLIGYVHILAVNSMAITRHQKDYSELTIDQKGNLNSEVGAAAMGVAARIDAAIVPPKDGTPPAVN